MWKKFFILLILTFYSCSVVPMVISPIVSGTIIWKNGEASKYYNEKEINLYNNLKISLKNLKIPIRKESKLKNGHYIVAGNNDKFKIWTLNVEHNITVVYIRINFLGDKPYAELIYKEIDSNYNVIEFNNGKRTK